MFKPALLKNLSYIALVCCSVGILLAIYESIIYSSWIFYLSTLSWILLCYSSFLGTKLSTYELYDEDMKRLGIYIYGIIALFIVFFFFNFSLGFLPAVFLAITLHNQKKGFDTWMKEKEQTDLQN